MAVLGWSISVISILRATETVPAAVFWAYQFVADVVAVTWVITTIIHLGYAFYPTTRHQTTLWRTVLASVVLYDLVAVGELCFYCYSIWWAPEEKRYCGGTISTADHCDASPELWIHWMCQFIKILTSILTIAYLFVSPMPDNLI
ncbi:hypothetical protein BG004_002605 [Podila humilis]|nr:hypothetical protein BG004_002605 [Podila humilis]